MRPFRSREAEMLQHLRSSEAELVRDFPGSEAVLVRDFPGSEAVPVQDFLLNTGPLTEVVRLRDDVARENGLRSEWTVAAKGPRGEEDCPEGWLSFSQPWATEGPNRPL